MTDFFAFIMGVLEGLTEFIPVSSTGHLILLGAAMGDDDPAQKVFEVFIQLGAILAVSVLYWEKLYKLIKSLFTEGLKKGLLGPIKGVPYSSMGIILASLPPLVCGYFFYSSIKEFLFYPVPVSIALIVGGALLILVEHDSFNRRTEKVSSNYTEVSIRDSLFIGLFQCLALWPGMSRSGSCLIGARFIGVPRVLAAEFSFIVALPIIAAAVFYDLLKNWEILLLEEMRPFIIGFVTSFVVGGLSVKLFISFLQRYSMFSFGVYRILVGFIALVLYFTLASG